ncbi:MAG: flotillin domain-containing protein [Hyphomicrobiaceae bacterium]
MSGQLIGTMILWLIVAVIAIAILVYLVNWLYRRSSKEVSFVRTGFMGEKVVINGGAFVLPFVHEVTPVSMNALQMEVVRDHENALITKDRMRVDMVAEFYVRVAPNREAVSAAAATLGRRTMEQERLHALLSGKFIGALRSVAAKMDMVEMHEQRYEFARQVEETASEALAQNGLELEAVAITELDQTDLEYFNPSNRFDAEGLTRLIEEIETRRKLRNDIEQDALIKIRSRNLEAEKETLQIERESEVARLDQEREIEIRKAEQRADVTRERSQRDTEAEQAEINAREEIEKLRITHEETLSRRRIASELVIRQQEIDRVKEVEAAEIAAREETERARLEQERAIAESRISTEQETQRREIERQRAIEGAEISSREQIEAARIAQEAKISGERILRDEETRNKEIASALTISVAEIASQDEVERARLASELQVERERILTEQTREVLAVDQRKTVEIAEQQRAIEVSAKAVERTEADQKVRQAEIQSEQEVEKLRVARDRVLDEARIQRERSLELLEIARRQALEEAGISSNEDVERARIASERGLDEARIVTDRDIRQREIEREHAVEVANIDKAIAVYNKSKEQFAAQIEAEAEHARAAQAEEQVATVRDSEVAKRRRTVEVMLAEKERDERKILAEADRIRAEVEAEAQRLVNEAENILTDEARYSIYRRKLLDKVEGIVRESVRPMEKIEGINILHVEGLNGGGSGEGRNMTDEVIDSALRYRVQAPMIDSLLRDVGIEGGSLAKSGGLIREARDLDSIVKSAEAAKKKAEGGSGNA